MEPWIPTGRMGEGGGLGDGRGARGIDEGAAAMEHPHHVQMPRRAGARPRGGVRDTPPPIESPLPNRFPLPNKVASLRGDD